MYAFLNDSILTHFESRGRFFSVFWLCAAQDK
jgi:hypothetical protein